MRKKTLLAAVAACFTITAPAWTATYPTGFRETLVTSSLVQPTHFAIASDGRVFVAEKQGRVRLIKNGVLLSTPVLTVTVHTERYRGIMGIALDRAFATNGQLFIYYTTTTPTIHNRVSRFTVVGDTAGSETVLFDLPASGSAAHNGGALAVGTDGHLYIGSGDDNVGDNAQTLSTVRGKILRLATDGTIPTNNPFYNSTSGINRAIWAMGVRQPWSIGFDEVLGTSMMHDVGSTQYEEINRGRAGANYGHPITEGPTTDSRFDAPIHSYRIGATGTTGGCAVIGGAFYRPALVQFPSTYVGRYFFADHCNGWMKTLDPSNGNAVAVFATGMTSGDGLGVSDIQVAPDGSLYYVLHNGRLHRVTYDVTATPAPTATPTPTPTGPVTPTATPTPTPTAAPCWLLSTSSTAWRNAAFTPQAGTFTYELDARPSTATVTAFAGLSQGAASGGQSLVANVRFRQDGFIEARDGSTYRSASPLRYFANMQYHIRMVVNVTTDTYSVYVKPLGEGEVLLGSNYQFRIPVASLDNFGAGVTSTSGTFEICNRVLTGGTQPTPRPTSTPTPTPTGIAPRATPTPTPTPNPTSTPTPTATPGGTHIDVTPGASGVTASTHDGNVPANTVDGSLATRWSASGDGQWIQYDLGTSHTVAFLQIAWYQGNTRRTTFDAAVSDSATGPWTNVVTGQQSAGTTTNLETYDFADAAGRYLRITGHGNTLNLWNSVTEVNVFAVP